MTRLWADEEGPGSYEEIVEYVRTVLEQNFEPNDERRTWDDPYGRGARALSQSVLHRLKIGFVVPAKPDSEE